MCVYAGPSDEMDGFDGEYAFEVEDEIDLDELDHERRFSSTLSSSDSENEMKVHRKSIFSK